jgi:hypothetical protein
VLIRRQRCGGEETQPKANAIIMHDVICLDQTGVYSRRQEVNHVTPGSFLRCLVEVLMGTARRWDIGFSQHPCLMINMEVHTIGNGLSRSLPRSVRVAQTNFGSIRWPPTSTPLQKVFLLVTQLIAPAAARDPNSTIGIGYCCHSKRLNSHPARFQGSGSQACSPSPLDPSAREEHTHIDH